MEISVFIICENPIKIKSNIIRSGLAQGCPKLYLFAQSAFGTLGELHFLQIWVYIVHIYDIVVSKA